MSPRSEHTRTRTRKLQTREWYREQLAEALYFARTHDVDASVEVFRRVFREATASDGWPVLYTAQADLLTKLSPAWARAFRAIVNAASCRAQMTKATR